MNKRKKKRGKDEKEIEQFAHVFNNLISFFNFYLSLLGTEHLSDKFEYLGHSEDYSFKDFI